MSELIQTDPRQDQGLATTSPSDFQPLFQEDDLEITALDARPRKRRGWVIALIIVLLVAVIGGGTFFYIQRNNNNQVAYSYSTVSSGNLTVTVSASGPLAPNAEYNMNFTAAGQVTEIDVKLGQMVTAGQTLAKINSTSLEDALAQAQQNVNNAQVVYNDAVDNGASQSQLDQDNNSLQSAKLALKTTQDNLAATTMTAPGNATVAAINGIVGQNVTSGGSSASSSSSTSFIVLVDLSSFTISSQVNEADIGKVQVGQPVQFTVNAYPSATFRATVSSVDIIGQTSSSVVSYPVVMSVDMNSLNGAHLYPGMTATANITTAQRIGATLVSNSAFSFITTAEQAGVINRNTLLSALRGSQGAGTGTGSQRLVLVMKNGQFTPVLVTVGLTNGSFSEVLAGLQPGEQVVVGATGGPFANLSSSSSNSNSAGLLRGLGGGGGAGKGKNSGG